MVCPGVETGQLAPSGQQTHDVLGASITQLPTAGERCFVRRALLVVVHVTSLRHAC